MYGVDQMTSKQREYFFNWYHTVKDQEFDCRAELELAVKMMFKSLQKEQPASAMNSLRQQDAIHLIV